jgi:hypothetical protein
MVPVYILISLLSLADETGTFGSGICTVVYLISLIELHDFHFIFLILANLAGGLLLFADMDSGYIQQIAPRCSAFCYAASKLMATFVTVVLWILLANLLLTLTLAIPFPLSSADTASFCGVFQNPAGYLLFLFTCEGLFAGFLSVLVLSLTLYVPNLCVLLMAPVPFWYVLSLTFRRVQAIPFLNLYALSHGKLTLNNSAALSAGVTVGMLLLYAMAASGLFLGLFRWRIHHEAN